jgi:hypothetical protein
MHLPEAAAASLSSVDEAKPSIFPSVEPRRPSAAGAGPLGVLHSAKSQPDDLVTASSARRVQDGCEDEERHGATHVPTDGEQASTVRSVDRFGVGEPEPRMKSAVAPNHIAVEADTAPVTVAVLGAVPSSWPTTVPVSQENRFVAIVRDPSVRPPLVNPEPETGAGGADSDASARHIDLESGTHDVDSLDADTQASGEIAGIANCPRCTISCTLEDEERVFGFRNMRWTNATGDRVSVVRRQSYCKRCRAEHAAEMRERRGRKTVTPEDVDSGGPPVSSATASTFETSDPPLSGTPLSEPDMPAQCGRSPEPGKGPTDSEGPTVDSDPTPADTEAVRDADAVGDPLTEALTGSSERPRVAPQYRAPSGARPHSPSITNRDKARTSHPPVRREREATTLEIRVLFDRLGFCSVSLLPKRPAGWPAEVKISTGFGDIELDQLQDGWYDEIHSDDIGNLLKQGFVWNDPERDLEWVLSRREVFTLGARTDLRGFVTCPRLVIGREHLVLCTSSRLAEVEDAVREAGCSNWTTLQAGDGGPREWTLLRGVVPRRAVPRHDSADILNVLRPIPEIDIVLEGGVHLEYNAWLHGCPPVIRIYGDPEHLEPVVVDGQPAVADASGAFTVPGATDLGDHQIWCSSVTKSYSIVRRPPDSSLWSAHRFPSPSHLGTVAICGPLVHELSGSSPSDRDDVRSELLTVPSSNRVLLGANPGELRVAQQRRDLSDAPCLTSVSFEPVWALPAAPLLCDKRRSSIRCVARSPANAEPLSPSRIPHNQIPEVRRWCAYVLDSARKGITVEPNTPEVAALWCRYRECARELGRRLK